ncbi:hypothetical protein BMT54_07625 [Pasteurellaceae bacterium 15-036681]|nr:hypothetical protein BMT54_07625 [Pasteurellaceae bacterium 15-036681]
MLLLEKRTTFNTNSARKIVVISQREAVRDNISQQLRINGIDYVDALDSDFFGDTNLSFSAEEILGIVLDVGAIHSDDVQSIVNGIYGLIPQNIWCTVVGDNDSISLAQQFLDQGIFYYHLASQTQQMVEQVIKGVSTPKTRTSVNIHILGCKGGIGNTLISSHTATLIANKKKVPVLLVQHDSGTPDLDLAFGKRILPGTQTEFDSNLRLMIGDINKLKEDTLARFNFIIHDLPIFNKKKEEFATLLEQGSNFVLVIERRLSSLRTAKQFLDEYKRVQQAQPKPRRVFVCINDHRSELSRLMAIADIERLLEHPIDFILPFIRKTSDKAVDTEFNKIGKTAINRLVMSLLGMISRQQKKQSKSLFVAIYRYFMNK